MTSSIKELRFDGENGRDEFRREQVAEKVINLLTSEVDVSPMVIDGDWGTGKTEFCQKLIHKFKSEHHDYQLLYVDAFQADHADDPLMTILAAVAGLLPEGNKKDGFLKKAIPVARYGFQAVIKAGVSYLLKKNADEIFDGLEEHLQDSANKVIDASVAAVLKDHENAKKNLEALQSALAELAKDSPIVIFIDELDRCRPDFAVHMLEVTKHTFDVENVKFVLVTNTKQLRAAINHSYGPLVDAQRYLDKFLKFNFKLPSEVGGSAGYCENQELASVKYFANLLLSSAVLSKTELNDTRRAYFGFVSQLIRVNQLSLREVETFTRYLEIYQSLSQGLNSNTSGGDQLLKIFGVFVFCLKHDVYDGIQSECTDAEVIALLFGVTILPDYTTSISRDHAVTIGVLLAQRAASNAELFIPNDKNIQECWKADFDRYFGHGTPADVWQPVKEVFSVLSLSSQRYL